MRGYPNKNPGLPEMVSRDKTNSGKELVATNKEKIPPDYSGGILSVNANTFLTMCRVRICASW